MLSNDSLGGFTEVMWFRTCGVLAILGSHGHTSLARSRKGRVRQNQVRRTCRTEPVATGLGTLSSRTGARQIIADRGTQPLTGGEIVLCKSQMVFSPHCPL